MEDSKMYIVKWNNKPLASHLFHKNEDCNCRKPATNIMESDDAFIIDIATPGISKEDIKINLDKDVLTVSYENGKEDNANYTLREFANHSFCRSFSIPETIDAEMINAKFNNGILNVVLPKKEETKPFKKEVKVS